MKMRFEIAFGIKLECEHLTMIRDSWNYVCVCVCVPQRKIKGNGKAFLCICTELMSSSLVIKITKMNAQFYSSSFCSTERPYISHFSGHLIANILKYSKNRLLTYRNCVYPLFSII